MNVPEKFVIYAIADPRTEEIRYVGQTKRPSERSRVHLRGKAHGKIGQWECELLELGFKPIFRKLESDLAADEVDDAECFWILKGYAEEWPLLNVLAGTTGFVGGSVPKETRDKIAASMTEKWADPEFKAAQTQRIRDALADPEVRARLSAHASSRELSVETKQKISGTMYELWQNEEYRATQQEAVANAARELWQDPDFRKAHAEGMQKPETKVKISEASKRMWQDPEIRAKLTQERRSRTLSEEHRAKISEGLRRHWEERRKRKQVAP